MGFYRKFTLLLHKEQIKTQSLLFKPICTLIDLADHKCITEMGKMEGKGQYASNHYA